MKHKHAELIKAWADGARIQVYTDTWRDDSCPLWRTNLDYRIKPEEKKPVIKWLWAYKSDDGWQKLSHFFTEDEAKKIFRSGYQRLDWSRTEFAE